MGDVFFFNVLPDLAIIFVKIFYSVFLRNLFFIERQILQRCRRMRANDITFRDQELMCVLEKHISTERGKDCKGPWRDAQLINRMIT